MKKLIFLLVSVLFMSNAKSQNIRVNDSTVVITANQSYGYSYITGSTVLTLSQAKAIFEKALMMEPGQTIKCGDLMIMRPKMVKDAFYIHFQYGSIPGAEYVKNFRQQMFQVYIK